MVDLAEDQPPAETEDRMITDDEPSAVEDQQRLQTNGHETSIDSLEDTIIAHNPADPAAPSKNVAQYDAAPPQLDDGSSTRPSLEHPGIDSPLSPSYQPRESSSFEAAAWTHLDLSWDEDEEGVTVEEQALSRERLFARTDHIPSTPLDEWVNTRIFGAQDVIDHHRAAVNQSNVSPFVHGSSEIPPTPQPANSGQRLSRTIRNVNPGKDLRRTAHNMVEKRYRVNLNGKIAALRDSLPRFRARVARVSGNVDGAMGMNHTTATTTSSSSASRVGKGEVLTDAVEYIRQLEGRIRNMAAENSALRARMAAIQEGTVNGVGHSHVHQRHSHIRHAEGEVSRMDIVSTTSTRTATEMTTPQDGAGASAGRSHQAPQGMIQVPENIRRLRILKQPQPHYIPPFLVRRVDGGEKDVDAKKGTEGGLHKLKVGSLADIL